MSGINEAIEYNKTLNDIQREKIKEYAKEHGTCYLGNINFYPRDKEKQFRLFTGEKIDNFEFEFIVPKKDQKLEELIELYNKKSSDELLNKILNRINKLNGMNLFWV